jgi:hypothetical protein
LESLAQKRLISPRLQEKAIETALHLLG